MVPYVRNCALRKDGTRLACGRVLFGGMLFAGEADNVHAQYACAFQHGRRGGIGAAAAVFVADGLQGFFFFCRTVFL